ncbi:sugar isomerase domain-containing protein [Bacillus sp. JCM 19041]|uniref:sugar isomerase domain-containing protein n=1 Tax=Bacillus sp. JCM 19041 TaxID=1460637 RepID=UPI0006D1D262
MQYTAAYYKEIQLYIDKILETEEVAIMEAAHLIANQVKDDRLVYVYGPGGHSNLGAQELFYRAGGLIHVSAILDEGTLLSNGALRSMAVERTLGYGRMVIDDYQLEEGDLLILVNAYGINTALIDAAMAAKERGVRVIGVSSIEHAENTPLYHPARHPEKHNVHDLVDVSIDSKVKIGDAVVKIPNQRQRIGAISTYVNAFILNSIVIEAVGLLAAEEIQPPIWMSGNADGGDEWNGQFINRFKGKIKKL